MKSQIIPFMKYSLLCTILLSTAALAMEPEEKRQRRPLPTIPQAERNIPQKALKVTVPHPPKVTYNDYVSVLLLGDDIEGWKIGRDTIQFWLRDDKNKAMLQDKDGVDLGDFPFFQGNLGPDINEEANKLTCKYYFRFPQEDVPHFLLYHDASPEQIAAVKKFEKEKHDLTAHRFMEWTKDLREKRAFTSAVEISSPGMMSEAFVPTLSHKENSFSLSVPVNQQKNSCNFIYLDIDLTNECRNIQTYYSSNGLQINMNAINEWKTDSLRLTSPSVLATEKMIDSVYCTSTGPIQFGSLSLNINNCLFSNGYPWIMGKNIKLKNAFFRIQREVKFDASFSYNRECPIKDILIYPANIQLPMLIEGTLNFTGKPQINLHMLNVSSVEVNYKEN